MASLYDNSIPGLNVLVTIDKEYLEVVDYRSYWLTYKSQHYDKDVTSEIHKMRKNIAAKMQNTSFSERDRAPVNDF